MNHLLEIRAICKALLLWLSGANAVHYVNRKIRKKLIYKILRILRSDPVGIQTQDLQNRNQMLDFFGIPLYIKVFVNHKNRICADFAPIRHC